MKGRRIVAALAQHRTLSALAAVAVIAAIVTWGLYLSSLTSRPVSASPRRSASPAPSPTVHPTMAPTPKTKVAASGPQVPDVSKMRLVLDATFDGSALDRSLWATCFPWFRSQAAGCTNYKDTEYDWYMPSQVVVSGGSLHLIAQPIATTGFTQTGAKKVYYCRSGMISSYPSLNFEYGYIEVVAQVSNSENMWNALWLSASNLKWPPEIDMVESLGPPFGGASMTFHAVGGGGALLHLPRPNVLPYAWHVFSVNWTPSSVTWFIDGKVYLTTRQNVPHQPMYFMANLARYTKFVTTPACSGTMNIRSVRVWQP